MPRRGSRARRSPAEWGVRGALALVAAVLGYGAVTRSAGYAMRIGDGARAHALAPGDGRVTGLYAQALSGLDATPADRLRADRLARQALRQDPTAVAAAATLGLDAQIRGDVGGSRRLFAYAERLSRRDLRTQVWAIEDAVGRGDVAGALRHYDIALRTSREAPALLFPVLASAAADPGVRPQLIRTLARQPLWAQAFIEHVAGKAADPRITAALLAGLRQAGVPVSDAAQAATVQALVTGGFVDAAWDHYASIRPGAERRMSRDPGFTADLATPSPFDWTPVDTAGLSGSVQHGAVDYAAPAMIGGPVLRQLQLLPAGQYALQGRANTGDQPQAAQPYWVLSCLDGRELGRVALPASQRGGGAFAGRFTVPAGCAAQYLTLVVRPSDAAAGTSGQVERVQLRPVR